MGGGIDIHANSYANISTCLHTAKYETMFSNNFVFRFIKSFCICYSWHKFFLDIQSIEFF